MEVVEAVEANPTTLRGTLGPHGTEWDFEVWMCSAKTVGSSLRQVSCSGYPPTWNRELYRFIDSERFGLSRRSIRWNLI